MRIGNYAKFHNLYPSRDFFVIKTAPGALLLCNTELNMYLHANFQWAHTSFPVPDAAESETL